MVNELHSTTDLGITNLLTLFEGLGDLALRSEPLPDHLMNALTALRFTVADEILKVPPQTGKDAAAKLRFAALLVENDARYFIEPDALDEAASAIEFARAEFAKAMEFN